MAISKRTGALSAALATLAAGVSLAACSSPAPAAPAASGTAPVPVSTTVTPRETPSAVASPHTQPATVTKTFSGTGTFTSAPITFGCVADGSPITVKYSYSGNNDGYGGTNFAAELDDSQGLPLAGPGGGIVNDIAQSGGKTTHVYISTEINTPPFHLSVTDAATNAHWKFTFTCDRA